jgi:hypothetical protein
MCEIVGTSSLEGKTVADVFSGDDLNRVRLHLERRFSDGTADEYTVVANRADGVRVPILCSAMPDVNDQGEIVGAVALVRDLLAEDVSVKLLEAAEDLRSSTEILRAMAKESGRIVPFDMFAVTLYSADGDHSRILYLSPEHEFQATVRWREATGIAKRLASSDEVINVPNIEGWLEQPEWRYYRNDPDIQRLLVMGLRSSLSIPIVSSGRVASRVGFGRKRDMAPFSKQEEGHLSHLPLAATVRMALHYEE